MPGWRMYDGEHTLTQRGFDMTTRTSKSTLPSSALAMVARLYLYDDSDGFVIDVCQCRCVVLEPLAYHQWYILYLFGEILLH